MRLVFVSSTFKDMQFERDALKVRVAPRIDSFLAKYGENVHFGDLRWGVNTSELENEDSSKKVLKVCLDEIDDCRPYMIVFIGERYGWIPSSELLEETMKMKGIENVPSDISVTNLEIEYGALLSPDFEGRVLFYFRNPIDTSEMSEEERKIYEAESPLHKEKLEHLKKVIKEKYPKYIRTYDVKYDKASKTLVGLEPLMDQINEDLQRIFDIDLAKLNSLPPQERAIQNSHAYLERFYKNAYVRNQASLHSWNTHDVDLYEADENNFPLIDMIYGEEGSGRRTLLALDYKKSFDDEDILTIPFVKDLDEFTDSADKFVSTLIYKIEGRMGKKITNSDSIEYLAQLLDENEGRKKIIPIDVFVMNADNTIIRTLKMLEAYKPLWWTIGFYLQSDDYDPNKDDVPQFKYQIETEVQPLEDDEKILLINAIAKSRHKEISKPVIQKIIEKEDSDNPLYLSLIVERLLMLDHEDFQNIRNLGDGMEAINKYMSLIVDHSGNDLVSISKDILKEIIERTNPKMALKLVAINTLKNHLNKYAIEELFGYYGWEFNDLDYSLFKRLVPSIFAMSSDDSETIWFKNEQTVEAAKQLIEYYHESNHLDDVINWIEHLKVSDRTPDKFIEKCKAIFYREKGDVNRFVDSLLRVLTLEKNTKLSGFDGDILGKMYSLSAYYLKELTKSYQKEDGFHLKVDDEIIKRVKKMAFDEYIPLLNFYYTYYLYEKRTTKDLLRFNVHHFQLTYKLIEAYQKDSSNVVLRDFAHLYSMLALGIDMSSIEYIEDLKALEQAQEVIKFFRANIIDIQKLKDEDKIRIQLMTTSIFDSVKSVYDTAKDEKDDGMKKQIILMLNTTLSQLFATKEFGPLMRGIYHEEDITIEDKNKLNFCAIPLMFYAMANMYYDLGDKESAKQKFIEGGRYLKAYLKSVRVEELYNERIFASFPDTVECLIEYLGKAEETLDPDFVELLSIKIKLIHAIYPGNLKISLMGIKYAETVDNDEYNAFDIFRYFFLGAYFGLIDMPKIKYKDLDTMICAMNHFNGLDISPDIMDTYASYLLIDAYDKSDGDDDADEMIFDMIYFYVDDLKKTKLKNPFLLEVIDGIAELYKDPKKKKNALLETAKQYIKVFVK